MQDEYKVALRTANSAILATLSSQIASKMSRRGSRRSHAPLPWRDTHGRKSFDSKQGHVDAGGSEMLICIMLSIYPRPNPERRG